MIAHSEMKGATSIAQLMRAASHQRCPWHGAGCAAGVHAGAFRPQTELDNQLLAPNVDYAFEVATSSIRFGSGVTSEVGSDFKSIGAKNVMVFSDPNIAALANGPLNRALASLSAAGVVAHVFTDVSIEPTDKSFGVAVQEAKRIKPDAFLAVGGGSVMDTAKAANLYYSHPDAAFLDFVNAPVGKGLPVPGPVKPLIAVPTTAGTGSETTGVAIFDHTPLNAKTGIASRMLKPYLGIVDPDNTLTMPATVAAASGFDVLCHALESYTAVPFNQRSPRPASPQLRPAYQGANPFSDVWSTYSLRLLSKYFVRACKDRSDAEANHAMTLAATYAGIGFGNAGVHLAHGCSYGISGLNSSYVHPGYDSRKPLVPHGISVVMTAPAIFRRTAVIDPDRHEEAAALLRGDNPQPVISMYNGAHAGDGMSDDRGPTHAQKAESAGQRLSEQLLRYMDALGVPDGLNALGFKPADVPSLVKVTLPQRRVLALAPGGDANASEEVLSQIFMDSMKAY